MEDLPSITLEYNIGHDRHKIPMDGIHLVTQRDYLFFPHSLTVFTVRILASGAGEGIGGVRQREVLELVKLCFFFFLSLLSMLYALWGRCSAEKGFISTELKIVLQHMHKKEQNKVANLVKARTWSAWLKALNVLPLWLFSLKHKDNRYLTGLV